MTAPLYLTRAQVRAVDRRAIEDFAVPGVVLMENAGRGTADWLRTLGIRGEVAICCGKGNNGGDGFVIARHLDNGGIAVRIHLFAEPNDLTGDAAVNFRIIECSRLPLCVHRTLDRPALQHDLAKAEWIVDALFGTGLSGPLRHPFDEVVEAINSSPARVLSVDIPSGLDCDTGQPLGITVRADHTATFVAIKQGFKADAARPWLGQVHVIDIGAPRAAIEAVLP